jgi:hypothetical protein
MRFIIEAKVPVENGNSAILNGTLTKTIQNFLAEAKPEAAYFTLKEGQRTMFAVVDIKESHQMIRVLEPLWLDLNCDIQFHCAMVFEDMQKAGPDFEKIISARR